MFETLTIAPVPHSVMAGRMALAIACAATMFALAVSPAHAANHRVAAKSSCQAVSAEALTFARIQMGVVKIC
jgi:hypothetical protein